MGAAHNTQEITYCCHSESKRASKEWKKTTENSAVVQYMSEISKPIFRTLLLTTNTTTKNMIFIIIMNTFGALMYKYKCSMPNYMK